MEQNPQQANLKICHHLLAGKQLSNEFGESMYNTLHALGLKLHALDDDSAFNADYEFHFSKNGNKPNIECTVSLEEDPVALALVAETALALENEGAEYEVHKLGFHFHDLDNPKAHIKTAMLEIIVILI